VAELVLPEERNESDVDNTCSCVGFLPQLIFPRSGLASMWARIQPEVSMLPPGEEVGKAITPEEERALLDACGKSRSRSLLPFVILTLETGARKNTVRTLQ
jgi:hypothetical protein